MSKSNHPYENFRFFQKTFQKFYNGVNNLFDGLAYHSAGASHLLTNKAYQRFEMESDDLSDDSVYYGLSTYFDNTVIPHKIAVFKAGFNLWNLLPERVKQFDGGLKWAQIEGQLIEHDLSKFCYHERNGYLFHNFKSKEFDPSFEAAWNHHQKNNLHHPEYWISVNKNGTIFALEMPMNYVFEMVADWIGAGETYGNPLEPWLFGNLWKFLFHPKTAEKLLLILNEIIQGYTFEIAQSSMGVNIIMKELSND